ncbi:MAG TPA: hypothetical protein VJB65_04495, partial [Patescibacteria group bacterium]|nr:hypothetical protein [Patescibacteria group bacterium]
MVSKVSGTGLFFHTDFYFPMNIKGNIWNEISAWDPNQFGIEASSSFSILVHTLSVGFMQYILPNWVIGRIFVILPVFLT